MVSWLLLSTALAWVPRPVADDPLVWMPGTQPDGSVTLAPPSDCLQCHAGYDPEVAPVSTWQGSMMAQSARDPLFWASLSVALQDSLWAYGTPNAADPCLRCHAPQGWVEGRADPSSGAALTGSDHDGVHCDTCHRQVDPFYGDRNAGVREGADWVGYWDETNLSPLPSAPQAAVTLQRDKSVVEALSLFNGDVLFDLGRITQPGWTEATSGQMIFDPFDDKRGPVSDQGARHGTLYSRFHKSRDFCGTCHDVSNPALANAPFQGATRGDGVTVLPTEALPGYALPHTDRTASEMRASVFGQLGGAAGTGAFAPGILDTSRPGDLIAACQDCHMADREGYGCNLPNARLRPTDSVEHPKTGVGTHAIVGGNLWVPWLLAASVPGSPNHDPVVQGLLDQGPSVLTADLHAGLGLAPVALLEGREAALRLLEDTATIEDLVYEPATGLLTLSVVNHAGHKLPTGFGEARRAFLTITVWQGDAVVETINPFDAGAGTLVGMPAAWSSVSPVPLPGQRYEDALVYEERVGSTLLGQDTSLHLLLADTRWKDNRIPPRGLSVPEATVRGLLPVVDGVTDAAWFTVDEYAQGKDDVALLVTPGATRVDVRLSYQTVTREYVRFLADELSGVGATLPSPPPSGEAAAYVAQTDPLFDGLRAWGTVIEDLWEATRDVPGAAPVLLAHASWGCPGGVEVPGDGIDSDCDGREVCAVDDDRDGAPGPTLQLSSDLDCGLVGLTDPNLPQDCWDGDGSLTNEDADGDGWSTCAGDCDDGDPGVTACVGQPWLTGGAPLTPGQRATWTVTDVPPGRLVALLAGVPGGPVSVPTCGAASLDVDHPVLLGVARADATGTATWRARVPAAVAGRVVGFQAVVAGRCAVSNRLVRTGG